MPNYRVEDTTEFLSTVAHELRTPLTSLKGSIALILAGAAGDTRDEITDLLTIAHNNADRLIRLVDDMLDVAKARLGTLTLHLQPISVADCVRRALDSMNGCARQRDVTLKLDVGGDVPVVTADPDRVEQVAINLIANAIKFSPSGSTVAISVEHRKDDVQVAVTDSGPGIPKEDLAHVFDRFYQGRNARECQSGSGLGLAISKAILDGHGGSISARNNRGAGATFVFALPLFAHHGVHIADGTK